MEKVRVKWMNDSRGTIKGGKYDGCLVKCVDVYPSCKISLLQGGWVLVAQKQFKYDAVEQLEKWLNN